MALSLIDLFRFHSCTREGYLELKKNCKIIVSYVPFMLSFVDCSITRCRKNEESLFKKKDELSYNKNFKSVSAGRFNLPFQPMFYGSLPTYRGNREFINYNNQCPMFEVCKELQNHQSLDFPTFFTISYWKTIGELYVVNLCHDNAHLSENTGMSNETREFENSVQAEYTNTEFSSIKNVWEYFSQLSRNWNKDNCHYYNILTAFYSAFTEYYKDVYGKEINGIVYPSAMTQAKGLNIAINPRSVDEQLKLIAVQMYALKHRGLPYGYEPITSVVKVQDDVFVFDKDFEKEINLYNHLRYNNEPPLV